MHLQCKSFIRCSCKTGRRLEIDIIAVKEKLSLSRPPFGSSIPHVSSPPPASPFISLSPKRHTSSPRLIRCSTSSLFVLPPWQVVSFPCSEESPGVLRIMEWNAAVINPRGCWERKHRSVSARVITLYSPVRLSEEQGLRLHRQALPICRPFLQAWMFTLEGMVGVRGHRRDILTSASCKRSSLVLRIASHRAIISWWAGKVILSKLTALQGY